MKPGSSLWLRLVAMTSLILLGVVLTNSDALADKVPAKETLRPILMGEPEDPDGTIPDGSLEGRSSTVNEVVVARNCPSVLHAQLKQFHFWRLLSLSLRLINR